jgi:dTDP-glucose pyrophosphorylase
MQLVIPMSGIGKRFLDAGYMTPKPLIEIEGKPVIEHVVEMFPGIERVVFICNREQLDMERYRLRETLTRICPHAEIVAIDPHKLGPVFAVLEGRHAIDPDLPTVVNYCDFTCYWDFADFRRFVAETDCDGAIATYTGFHPHMLASTNFAYVRESGGWISDIQEKQPYTATPMQEHASSGTYYFRSGDMAIRYCEAAVREHLEINGEYYASLVYKPMLADRLRVAIYELEHFMQWGTPQDMAEYLYWSEIFRKLACGGPVNEFRLANLMMPMAGRGERFRTRGYAEPKPLISVSGLPMSVQAARALPVDGRTLFVLRGDLPEVDEIKQTLLEHIASAEFCMLDGETEGQACTCLAGAHHLPPDESVTIASCDHALIGGPSATDRLSKDSEADVIVWTFKDHPQARRNPAQYGWVVSDETGIVEVSVKVPPKDLKRASVVTGTFTFKRAADLVACIERMMKRNARANGEFYIDSCVNDAIALGLRCVELPVEAFLCWGTPEELRTFEYWQSCFHKWPSHPYRLEADPLVEKAMMPGLLQKCVPQVPKRPRLLSPIPA